jgi:phosphodiesterase/alkaline phosphatase D-like protein
MTISRRQLLQGAGAAAGLAAIGAPAIAQSRPRVKVG